jgi:hypothetical protein
MATIGGVDLGTVTSERSSKSSNLFQQALPRSDSDDAILLDLLGNVRTIIIEGYKTGVVADLRTFIQNIEALQNGAQDGMTFVSSWTNSNKTVLIDSFEHSKSEADESRVTYSLTLIEGTA